MADYRKFIGKQKAFYKSIVSVTCPILNDTVYFTSDGFLHLIYESNRKPRKQSEQYLKLKCLDHAPAVLGNCTQILEARPKTKKVKGKIKTGYDYELVHEVTPGQYISVVVEKIGSGKYKFVSVMRLNKKSGTKKHP